MSLVGKVISVTPKGYALKCVGRDFLMLPKKGVPKLAIDDYVCVAFSGTAFRAVASYLGKSSKEAFENAERRRRAAMNVSYTPTYDHF